MYLPEWSLDGILKLKVGRLTVVGDCHNIYTRVIELYPGNSDNTANIIIQLSLFPIGQVRSHVTKSLILIGQVHSHMTNPYFLLAKCIVTWQNHWFLLAKFFVKRQICISYWPRGWWGGWAADVVNFITIIWLLPQRTVDNNLGPDCLAGSKFLDPNYCKQPTF